MGLPTLARNMEHMTPGSLGGLSKIATPVAPRPTLRPSRPVRICMSAAAGFTDQLFVQWPDCSKAGDAILAYHVYDHETAGVLGDDVLSLYTTVSEDDWSGGFWEQQWFYGHRGAETGDNFYHSAPVEGMVIVVSFPSNNSGSQFGGIANGVFDIVENSPSIVLPAAVPASATNLLIASAWMRSSIPTIQSSGGVPVTTRGQTIGDRALTVSAYLASGSETYTFDGAGSTSAYSTLDAHYTPE